MQRMSQLQRNMLINQWDLKNKMEMNLRLNIGATMRELHLKMTRREYEETKHHLLANFLMKEYMRARRDFNLQQI